MKNLRTLAVIAAVAVLPVFASAGTTQIGTSATATNVFYSGGDFFGLRSRLPRNASSGSAVTTVNFDNFTAIPEPSSAALMILAALGIAATRNRRA